MSNISIRGTTYNCAYAKVDTGNAPRAQSARIFDPRLNVPSFTLRDANDAYSGRPASHNTANGVSGMQMSGMAGLSASPYVLMTTNHRPVEFMSNYPHTTFYDTIANANRSNFYSERAGQTCGVYNGPDSYTSTPRMTNCHGNGMESADRKNYLQSLQHEYYNANQTMYN